MSKSPTHPPNRPQVNSVERRNFLVATAAAIIGGITSLFPIAVGLFSFADPLRRRNRSNGDGFIRIASFRAVPPDGVPRQFAVISDRTDAWNRYPNEPIGAIYLRRTADEQNQPVIEAFNAICPHAGCFVAYASDRRVFQCPCHNSAFGLDGSIIEPSPSPRPMDTLEAQIRTEGDSQSIWVKFENYYSGRAEKSVKA